MDHLIDSVVADDPSFLVPYVCGEGPGYDGQDFITYPIRMGWTTSENPYGWYKSCSRAEDIAYRAQSWLYFGLLEAWLGEKIAPDDFLGLQNGTNPETTLLCNNRIFRVISGKRIQYRVLRKLAAFFGQPRYNELGVQEISALLFMEKLEAFTSGIFCSHQAQPHSEMLDQLSQYHLMHIEDNSGSGEMTKYLPRISFSIKILLEILLKANEFAWKRRQEMLSHFNRLPSPELSINVSGAPQLRLGSNARTLIGFMLSKGWCRYQIRRFGSRFTTSTMAYLASVTNPDSGGNAHGKCTKDSCQANNSNMENYEPQHTPSCQRNHCEYVGFDTHEVAEIIRKGGTPLISFSATVDGKPDFKLKAAEPTDEYFIISHVWADGLGNPDATKLPLCQCQRIQTRLMDLRNHLYEINVRDSHRWRSCTEYLKRLPFHKRNRMTIFKGPKGNQLEWVERKVTLLKYSYRFWKPRTSRYKQAPCLFWMDTFCIPVGDSNKEWKWKAISDMARIYAKAEMMVVLTKITSQVQSEPSDSRISEQLACSAWMSRSWTCQEAALASDWHTERTKDAGLRLRTSDFTGNSKYKPQTIKTDFFSAMYIRGEELNTFYTDLSDYTADADIMENNNQLSLKQRLAEFWTWKIIALLFQRFLEGIYYAEQHEIQELNIIQGFAGAWNSLAGRTTTKPEDVDSIIAVRLGFIPLALWKIDDACLRMKSILKSYGRLPLALLYSNGEKLSGVDIKDSWIPKFPGAEIINPRHGYMSIISKGVSISQPKDPPLCYGLPVYTRGILIPTSALEAVKIRIFIPTLDLRLWVNLPSRNDHEILSESSISLCILVSQLQEPSHSRSDCYLSSTSSIIFDEGACLEIQDISGSVLNGTYNCPVRISMFEPFDLDENDNARVEYPEFVGEMVPLGHKILLESDVFEAPSLHNVKNYLNGIGSEVVISWFLYEAMVVTIAFSVGVWLLTIPGIDYLWKLLLFSLWVICLVLATLVVFIETFIVSLLSPSPYEEWLQYLQEPTKRRKIRNIMHTIRGVHPTWVLLVWMITIIRYNMIPDYHLAFTGQISDLSDYWIEVWVVYTICISSTIRFFVRIGTQTPAEWQFTIATLRNWKDNFLGYFKLQWRALKSGGAHGTSTGTWLKTVVFNGVELIGRAISKISGSQQSHLPTEIRLNDTTASNSSTSIEISSNPSYFQELRQAWWSGGNSVGSIGIWLKQSVEQIAAFTVRAINFRDHSPRTTSLDDSHDSERLLDLADRYFDYEDD